MFARLIQKLVSAVCDPPVPEGFERISTLPVTTPENAYEFRICDWRPLMEPEYPGCFFLWLEVDGKKTGFFLTEQEAAHFDSGPNFRQTHVRIARHHGKLFVLPFVPQSENSLSFLPPPPKEFQLPPEIARIPSPDAVGSSDNDIPNFGAKRNRPG